MKPIYPPDSLLCRHLVQNSSAKHMSLYIESYKHARRTPYINVAIFS